MKKNEAIKKQQEKKRKRTLSIILVCSIIVGIVATGIIILATNKSSNMNNSNTSKEVSDSFYLQIYDDNDNIVAKYEVSLTGIASGKNSKITSVSFSYVAGVECETDYTVEGNIAGVAITHPTEGQLVRVITLNANGEFTTN